MVRLNWTNQAVEDLNDIAEYIAKDSIKYSKIQILRIRERARLLKNNPLLGRVVPEINQNNIRELIFKNYRIIYKIVDELRVDILFIYHSSRLLPR